MTREIIILGLMSGTSLDGLDAALCSFQNLNKRWKYKTFDLRTIPYDAHWRKLLNDAFHFSGREITQLNCEYGIYLSDQINKIIRETGIKPELIASHGHTVFHSPGDGYTMQLGHGGYIASRTGIPVASDFRSSDIAKGGQGAPLVPVGDKLLFQEYESCLNLGGFANISFDIENRRKAFDICPVNAALNYYAAKLNSPFDKNGIIGKSGTYIPALLTKLNSLAYYEAECPKSLSREWLESDFLPTINNFNESVEDILASIYFHIVTQIAQIIKRNKLRSVLVTGGGAHNNHLMDLLKKYTSAHIIKPERELIDYKEAIIFAFLGLLRKKRITNCLSSVTGADSDSICGSIYY